jgi:hypothetical protein
MDELKPCPFCGRAAVIANRVGGWTVDCKYYDPILCAQENVNECAFTGSDILLSKEEAIIMWNTRPIEDKLLADLRRLREENANLKQWAEHLETIVDEKKVRI